MLTNYKPPIIKTKLELFSISLGNGQPFVCLNLI